jgi:GntR family transcriptional regulator
LYQWNDTEARYGETRFSPSGPALTNLVVTMSDAIFRVGTRVRIDPASRIPPFEQLRAQLALMVSSGRLLPGTRLPTIRGLAEVLELSNGTVARAYRELEAQGIVAGRGRRGTYVADNPPNTSTAQERRRLLSEAAAAFAATVRQLDVDDTDATEAVVAALRQRSTF